MVEPRSLAVKPFEIGEEVLVDGRSGVVKVCLPVGGGRFDYMIAVGDQAGLRRFPSERLTAVQRPVLPKAEEWSEDDLAWWILEQLKIPKRRPRGYASMEVQGVIRQIQEAVDARHLQSRPPLDEGESWSEAGFFEPARAKAWACRHFSLEGPEAEKCLFESPPDSTPAASNAALVRQRRDLYDAYKRQCAQNGIKLTMAMFAKAANPTWNDPTPVKRWKSGDTRLTLADEKRILDVLARKPHLQKPQE